MCDRSAPIFRRENASFDYTNREPFVVFPIECSYANDTFYPKPHIPRVGYLIIYATLINNKKIAIILHSYGIHKATVMFTDQIEYNDYEDPNETEEQYYSNKFNQLYDDLKAHCIMVRPHYLPTKLKLVNMGYENNIEWPSMEIYMASRDDLVKFFSVTHKLDYIRHEMPATKSGMTEYAMRTFIIPLFCRYRVHNWDMVIEPDKKTNLDVEIKAEFNDFIPIHKDEIIEYPCKLVTCSFDIETRNEATHMDNIKELMKDSNSIVFNVVFKYSTYEIPGTFSHIETHNIYIMHDDQAPHCHIKQDGTEVIRNFPVENELELCYMVAHSLNNSKPDIIAGHNMLKFDLPVLMEMFARHGFNKFINMISCTKINYYNMNLVQSNVSTTYNITQDCVVIAPTYKVPGMLKFDTMLIALKHFGLKSGYIKLDKVASRLGISTKHDVSINIMHHVYKLILERISGKIPTQSDIDELYYMHKNSLTYDSNSEFSLELEAIKYNSMTPWEMVALLNEKFYRYCIQDTYIVENIMEKTHCILEHFKFANLACLTSERTFQNRMFSIVHQYLIASTHLCDELMSFSAVKGIDKNPPGYGSVKGGTMYVDQYYLRVVIDLLSAFDIRSAYPYGQWLGMSYDNGIYKKPTKPGKYIKYHIANDEANDVLEVWFKFRTTFLGSLAWTTIAMRNESKRKLALAKKNNDPLSMAIYKAEDAGMKLIGVCMYGVSVKNADKSIHYMSAANATTMNAANVLVQAIKLLYQRGYIKEEPDLKYTHTDSVIVKIDYSNKFPDMPPSTEPIAYYEYIREHLNDIIAYNKSITDDINERLKKVYQGYDAIKMGFDGLFYGSAFIEQGTYVYMDISDGIPDKITEHNLTYKKIKSLSEKSTDLNRLLIKKVLTEFIEYMIFNGTEPDGLINQLFLSVKEFMNNIDPNDVSQFLMTHRYYAHKNNIHINNVVQYHNTMVKIKELDIPLITNGSSINVIQVKNKTKWRISGKLHLENSNSFAITHQLYDPNIHEIDRKYYFDKSMVDIKALIKAFVPYKKQLKKIVNIFSDILLNKNEQLTSQESYYNVWFRLFEAIFEGDLYLGLGNYFTKSSQTLLNHVYSYCDKIERLAQIPNASINLTSYMKEVNADTQELLSTAQTNADMKLAKAVGNLNNFTVAIKDLLVLETNNLYINKNPLPILIKTQELVQENYKLIVEANDCAKNFSMIRFVNKLLNERLLKRARQIQRLSST